MVLPELLCAVQEILSASGGAGMLGVTRERLLTHFIRDGVQWLGPPSLIEGEIERAFFVPTASIRPTQLCRRYNITSPVIRTVDNEIISTRAA